MLEEIQPARRRGKMTRIVRLEGLDAKAGAQDIRAFFKSLNIPDGGVYIVGGCLGEAFIAFTTESEAQTALLHTGKLLKGSLVTLHVSSMQEIEQRLQESLKKKCLLSARTSHPCLVANGTSKPEKDIKGNVKPKSRLRDGNRTKVGRKSRVCENATNMKSKSRLRDVDMVKVRTKSWPHSDRTSVTSSAASPQEQGPSDPPASISQHLQPSPTNCPASNAKPLDTRTAFLLGICTVLQSLKATQTMEQTFELHDSKTISKAVRNQEHISDLTPGYARLFGLPASTTKEDICWFFKGLHVEEAMVNVELGNGRGCLVKFADIKDASDALRFNQQVLGSVEVRGADEKMWDRALQECSKAFDDWSKEKPGRSPKERMHYEGKPVSPLQSKRKSDQAQLKPIKRLKPEGKPSASTSEYTVLVRNLPRNITKTEIKQLFRCTDLPHSKVLHLLDETRSITDTAFLIFNRTEDFEYAINLSGCHVGSGAIEVTLITKKIMSDMMAVNHPRNQRTGPTNLRLRSGLVKSDPVQTEAQLKASPKELSQRFIFVRNMPATVKKSQIRSLFCKFNLSSDDIKLLRDTDGNGTGEAVVKFKSEQQATLAQRYHGKQFLGTNVLLTQINGKQMENI